MTLNKRHAAILQQQNDKLVERIEEHRREIQGYQELGKIHAAYIAILVKRLGGTEDNPVEITSEEITNALDHYETRASFGAETDTYSVYCVEHEE